MKVGKVDARQGVSRMSLCVGRHAGIGDHRGRVVLIGSGDIVGSPPSLLLLDHVSGFGRAPVWAAWPDEDRWVGQAPRRCGILACARLSSPNNGRGSLAGGAPEVAGQMSWGRRLRPCPWRHQGRLARRGTQHSLEVRVVNGEFLQDRSPRPEKVC